MVESKGAEKYDKKARHDSSVRCGRTHERRHLVFNRRDFCLRIAAGNRRSGALRCHVSGDGSRCGICRLSKVQKMSYCGTQELGKNSAWKGIGRTETRQRDGEEDQSK